MDDAEAAIDRLDLQGAILAAMDFVRVVNNYVTENEPWQVAKDETRGADLDRILYATAEALRVVAVLLHPVMPKASTVLWDSLGARPTLGSLADAAGAGRRPLGPAAGRGDGHQEPSRCSRASRSPSRRDAPTGPTRARGGRVAGPRERPPAPEPLRMPVADSHCHLDIADPPDDWLSVDEALAASTAVGVPRIVQIGCDLPGARWAVETARRYDELVAGVALHPNEAPLLALRRRPRRGAGRDRRARRRPGRSRGRRDGARLLPDRPRTAAPTRRRRSARTSRWPSGTARRWSSTTATRTTTCCGSWRTPAPPDRVVFHCFSGDAAMAEHCVGRGWWLSFAGTVTFKNAAGLREALAVAPLDRLLVETDAPYLTPVPFRGRPNASYLVPHTLRAMAAVLGVEEDTLATAVAANTEAAFGTWCRTQDRSGVACGTRVAAARHRPRH